MQIYLPNLKTQQAFIGLFDYLSASRESNDLNVIFNSDLNLEDLNDISTGNKSLNEQWRESPPELFDFLAYVLSHFHLVGGQLFQDLYVLWKLHSKQQGIFVEVGTAYPNHHNNTYLLESQYHWTGVCIEPNVSFHDQIEKVRASPLDRRVIFSKSGQMLQLKKPQGFDPGLAIDIAWEPKIGNTWTDYDMLYVESVSLLDCLRQYLIPKEFDYLSFDTTGNRDDIDCVDCVLKDGYLPLVITVGHNYKSHRTNMQNMLESHGYQKEFDYLSKWDDWYFHPFALQDRRAT